MKTLRTTIASFLPEPYRSLAISRCDDPDEAFGGRGWPDRTVIACAFTWAETPEGAEFWSLVADHLKDGGPLPPFPVSALESRIARLESRVEALEPYPALDEPIPHITTPDPVYRLLSPGETIEEDDEALFEHATEEGNEDLWLPTTTVGATYAPGVNTIIRRRISNYTDA